ncbi:MAG: hypothetical protein DYG92_01620 [Leptolyngbya sp. PLA1]|nr:hypothetical protein [Leptolyngbya sp. PLA1]
MKAGVRTRGTVLIITLVVIAVSVLVCSAMAVRVEARLDSARVSMEREHLRALAWSGLQGVQHELEAQRAAMLEGEQPTLTREWVLFDDGSHKGIVRLIGGGPGATTSEMGRLDVNRADAAMLAKLPGGSEDLAARIVAARGAGVQAPEELVRPGAMTASEFYGSRPAAEESEAEATETPSGFGMWITTHSYDPNVQGGLGRGSASGEHAGQFRLHRGIGWSKEIGDELGSRLSAGALKAAEAALKSEATTAGALVQAMIGAGAGPEEWGEVLDVLTAADDQYLPGRVDINLAPPEVLSCLPGVSVEAAQRLAEVRTSLSADRRRSLAWPVREGVLTPEQFVEAVDWLTTRSLVWRVRVSAEIGPSTRDDAVTGGEWTPQARLVWEAVVDASSPQVRVAYLRDVTFLSAAVWGPQPNDLPESESPAAPIVGGERARPLEEEGKQNVPAGVFDMPTSLGAPRSLGSRPVPGVTSSRPAEVGEARAPEGVPDAASGSRGGAKALKDRRSGRWGTSGR